MKYEHIHWSYLKGSTTQICWSDILFSRHDSDKLHKRSQKETTKKGKSNGKSVICTRVWQTPAHLLSMMLDIGQGTRLQIVYFVQVAHRL